MKCEGCTRREGGMMAFGPVKWQQCEKEATVIIKFKQGREDINTLPACPACWGKCIDSENIEILSVEVIKKPKDE